MVIKMGRLKKLGVLGLAVMLLVTGTPLTAQAKLGNSSADGPDGMVQVAENEYLVLYLDEEETSLAVKDKESGNIWYTNPPEADEDETTTAYYRRVLKSQLQVQYYNENVQTNVMDNYNDSISHGQFSIDYLDDGVTITYTLGEAAKELLLPEAISEERMEQFMTKMSDKEKKKVGRNYSLVTSEDATDEEMAAYAGLKENNLYILRAGVKDYIKEELAGYFEEAGYTAQDYEADAAQSGRAEAESDKPWFTVPMTYRLDGANLVVTVNPDEVTYNENGYYLVDMDILPYFAAAGSAEEGYLFVPDGSGALIYLNNGKTDASAYSAYVYGPDKSKQVLSTTKSEIEESLTVKLPVYGIKAGDKALFAIIEEGAGYADISADISGRTTSYNNVYAGFQYLQYGPAALSDMVGANNYQLYGERNFSGNYQIRYSFLSGEKADYAGMAECYRSYLEQKKVLTRTAQEKLPFYTEYIGAIDKYKTFLGVKYRAVEPLTTFEQAMQISEQLKSQGVDNQKIIYSGWMNGGLHGTAVTKQKVVSSLQKGGINVKEFVSAMQEQEIDTFMTFDQQYVYQDKLFDGYSKMKYAPNYFDHSGIEVNSYYISDKVVEKKLASLISPAFALQMASQVQKGVNKYNLTGVNLGTASWDLYSDYLEKRYTDREKAVSLYKEGFTSLAENGTNMLGDNGNVYSWEYVNDMINVPLSSNGFQILDEDIPFYEMVLHGYVAYAGEAMNLADDYQTTLLKSVESGAGLYYKWIYEDNALLKETDYDYLYSIHYGNWLNTAAEDYAKLSEVMQGLEGQLITDHERNGDVTKTTYEDGTQIYVNYADIEIEWEGITIPAKNYVVRKGRE